MKQPAVVLWFKEIAKEDIPLVGGKCANLGELAGKIGVPVPNGFAVSANAYKVFLKTTKADKMIESLLWRRYGGHGSPAGCIKENQKTCRTSADAEGNGEGDPRKISGTLRTRREKGYAGCRPLLCDC